MKALAELDRRLADAAAESPRAPRCESFAQFLAEQARVPAGGGQHGPYSFAGREALIEIVATIDAILSGPLPDATVALAGGAQFGKTILELNLLAYTTACSMRNVGLYLPDDDLVEGVVDAKFRPDVVDQIEWFARMTTVGKALNKSGKAVNRKGAFIVTDGERRSVGMIRGLGKVPTTFSMDVAAMDEVDDIKPRMEKFVSGRLTASDLRFILKIGTQRIHGRGMNLAWKKGSQGVVMLTCSTCGKTHQPEEEFPTIVRLRDGSAPLFAPQLAWSGEFVRPVTGEGVARHEPTHDYFLGCVACGTELARSLPRWVHRRPDQLTQRNWSFRISQLSIGSAIDLSQIVAHWVRAVADPEEMVTFRCDRLGLPLATGQALTPDIIKRARADYDLPAHAAPGRIVFAGLDMGDRCWLLTRESDPATGTKRVIGVDRFSAADVVARTAAAFDRLGMTALFIDERPLVNEARQLALVLNGLDTLTHWPAPPQRGEYVSLPGGLTWAKDRWAGLRCAVVRFTKNKLGAGIGHGVVEFEVDGCTQWVPCIECNRFETIDRAVREFLTPAEGVVEVLRGGIRAEAALRLPRVRPGSPPILELLADHLVVGSERVTGPNGPEDYVDKCENHFLLADGYSALAESVCAGHLTGPRLARPVPATGRRAAALQRIRRQEVEG